jgi:lysophospholipase L1-like esterase
VISTIGSFAALGDSFTEGLQDDLRPDGRHLGWADRVAATLAEVNGSLRYANLGVRGKLLDQVVTEQVPVAERLRPDLVSFHAGLNDLLRPRVDRAEILRGYEDAVERLAKTGSRVVLFTVIARTGGSGRTADALAARFQQFTENVHRVAAAYDCLTVDIGVPVALQDRRLWHEDRLHPAPAGHARIAAAVLERLGVEDPGHLGGEAGWWQVPLPPREGVTRLGDLRQDVRWLVVHLAPWVGRRLRGATSGDRIPGKHLEYVELRGAAARDH